MWSWSVLSPYIIGTILFKKMTMENPKKICSKHMKIFLRLNILPQELKTPNWHFKKEGGCEKKFFGMELHHRQKFLTIKAHGRQRSDLGHHWNLLTISIWEWFRPLQRPPHEPLLGSTSAITKTSLVDWHGSDLGHH